MGLSRHDECLGENIVLNKSIGRHGKLWRRMFEKAHSVGSKILRSQKTCSLTTSLTFSSLDISVVEQVWNFCYLRNT